METKEFKKKSEMMEWLSGVTLVNAHVKGLTVSYEDIVKTEKDK